MPALRAASLAIPALLAALVPGASSAAAADEVPNGLQVTIDVFDPSLPSSLVVTSLSISGNVVPPGDVVNAATPLRVGYHFGQVSILLGLSVVRPSFTTRTTTTTPGGTSTTTEAHQSVLLFGLAPTVRYYFMPLQASGLSPYVQGELDLGLVGASASSTNANGTTTTPSIKSPTAVGFSLVGGVEYLFSRHFGVTGELRLRFMAASVSDTETTGGGGSVTNNPSANLLSVGATAGLSFHF
jgi:outer membrane protein W